MQLIVILLATVSILTFLSGFTVFFGSTKGYRLRSFWFFLAAIFATCWMTAISIFLTTSEGGSEGCIDLIAKWTFVSALLLDTAFLGYVSWHTKYGKGITFFFAVIALAISSLIMYNSGFLYESINLSPTGNTITLKMDTLYFSYIAFFSAIVPAIIFTFIKKQRKKGDIAVMTTFGISSTITLVANLILPLLNNWSLIWLGPLALAVTIIAFYYSILRYRSLNLTSRWLRLFSYIVIVTSLAIIYMVIFSIVFAAMFRGATPSTEVIVLNFIMVFIMILLMPAVNEFSGFIRSLISNQNNKKNKE